MKTHDLNLPDWGPYTKKYFGISHRADAQRGWRFDLSLAPGVYRRKVGLPNVLGDCGFHLWEASPGLDYYSYRHELEWKDQVYCDVAFARVDEAQRLVRCECINQTDSPQGLVLHLLASLHFPVGQRAVGSLPPEALWVNALDYRSFHYGEQRPGDGLASDLLLRGEVRGEGFVSGSGLKMGRSAGDEAVFEMDLSGTITNGMLLLRYLADGPGSVQMRVDDRATVSVELPATGKSFALAEVPLGQMDAGAHRLEWRTSDASAAQWDGFAMVAADRAGDVQFAMETRNPRPCLVDGPKPNTLVLEYEGLEQSYGIAWSFPNFRVREFLTGDLDCLMRNTVHDHVSSVLKGGGEGHYTDIYLHPVTLEPRSRQRIEAMVCHGSRESVLARLAAFEPGCPRDEAAFREGQAKAARPAGNVAGKAYEFSQARMSATTLTNVVYPAYARRSFIRHNTPGRWWDSLYTWDSGFIGLGLLELDVERAVDCLAAYLTEPGDPHAAFAHHGSPVPVQHYLFQELWNRTGSRELLERFYPGLRQYHHFLTGRDPRSTTRRMQSALLQSWDYFYNSGGWDDYPPQQWMHEHRRAASVSAVCNTAHAIRTAKILKMAAIELGQQVDVAAYEEDIALFSHALQTHAWDEASGYFGYVCHDAGGAPEGILRHESGANFNMGLDGVSPLIAGVCTKEQTRRLLDHLRSPERIWSPIGLSTVDQSAPYFRKDGYWNGAVWMPHQWFVWRMLLDLGETDLAFRIAQTALQVWAREVDASYHCFEHFIVETGRGAGWHQFSGLSTPVLCWFAAYYVPGRLTAGFDVWVRRQEFRGDHTQMRADLCFDKVGGPVAVLAVMNPSHRYRATWEGQEIAVRERSPGTLELVFQPQVRLGALEVKLAS